MGLKKEMRLLARAEKDKNPIGPISDRFSEGLSIEDAHMICEGNIQNRLKAGENLVGYKIGFTNIPAREKMGWPDSIYGHIMDSMVLKSGAEVPVNDLIAPKIECEICFKLGRDLGGKMLKVEEVLEATAGVSASFEICDSRFLGWNCPFPDIYADNGFAGRIVLPDQWHPVSQVDLRGEMVTMSQDGAEVGEGIGESAMGHPARAVSWLADKLADRNKGLKAGQLIMTGTLTPISAMEKGSTYTASFSSLGKVNITFI